MVITYQETLGIQQDQINVIFDYSVRKESTSILFFTPPSGLIDYYQEEVLFTNPIETRLNGFVTLINKTATKRDGTIITVINQDEGVVQYQGEYIIGNLGANIGSWQTVGFDTGTTKVSDWTIQQFDRYFAAVTMNDFEKRANSNYTLSGEKWNLANPSIQNPVTISSFTGTIGGSIVVQDTTYFQNSGYIFTSGGTVIQYTSKTATTFEGCTLYSGPDFIGNNDEIIPFEVS
jgi:hypothetical protein